MNRHPLIENLDELRRHLPDRSLALLIDIDGTISPIAPSSSEAYVEPECRSALQQLSQRLPLVAALSGRPVAEAARMVGVPQMVYLGNHGLERWEQGQVVPVEAAASLAWAVEEAVVRLRRGLRLYGIEIEHKGLTASIHYRNAEDAAGAYTAVEEAARGAIAGLPLRARQGRQVLEIHPDIDLHKGSGVEALLQTYAPDAAIYVGDDTTDIDAFRALHAWGRATQRWVAAVAVLSDETPLALAVEADYTVEGVAEVCALLQCLANEYLTR